MTQKHRAGKVSPQEEHSARKGQAALSAGQLAVSPATPPGYGDLPPGVAPTTHPVIGDAVEAAGWRHGESRQSGFWYLVHDINCRAHYLIDVITGRDRADDSQDLQYLQV